MFVFKEHKIISAVPLADIKKYLSELNAYEINEWEYDHAGLVIKITPFEDSTYPDLGIPRHIISADGDKTSAEEFLTAYRFRFMSAGG